MPVEDDDGRVGKHRTHRACRERKGIRKGSSQSPPLLGPARGLGQYPAREDAPHRVRRTDLERAQCQTLRLRLLRIGAVVTRNSRPTRFGSPAPDPIEPSFDCSYAGSPPDEHGPRPPLSRTTTPCPAPERSAALRHANTVPRPLHACFRGAKSPLHPARAGNSGRNLRATGANTPRNRNIRAFTRHPA